jgi:predicted methyltransferase
VRRISDGIACVDISDRLTQVSELFADVHNHTKAEVLVFALISPCLMSNIACPPAAW